MEKPPTTKSSETKPSEKKPSGTPLYYPVRISENVGMSVNLLVLKLSMRPIIHILLILSALVLLMAGLFIWGLNTTENIQSIQFSFSSVHITKYQTPPPTAAAPPPTAAASTPAEPFNTDYQKFSGHEVVPHNSGPTPGRCSTMVLTEEEASLILWNRRINLFLIV